MILDTNALSAFADGDEQLVAVMKSERVHQIPVIVLGEYRFGLKGSRHQGLREAWLDLRELEYEILVVDRQTARHYADIRKILKLKGRPIPENDLWIAALAVQHNLAVLTQDRHFSEVPSLQVKHW